MVTVSALCVGMCYPLRLTAPGDNAEGLSIQYDRGSHRRRRTEYPASVVGPFGTRPSSVLGQAARRCPALNVPGSQIRAPAHQQFNLPSETHLLPLQDLHRAVPALVSGITCFFSKPLSPPLDLCGS